MSERREWVISGEPHLVKPELSTRAWYEAHRLRIDVRVRDRMPGRRGVRNGLHGLRLQEPAEAPTACFTEPC
jgi:hypothetical protein